MSKERSVEVKSIPIKHLDIHIRGLSPLLQNLRIPDEMKEKDMTPREEAEAKLWLLGEPSKGCIYGHPAVGFKASVVASVRTIDPKGMKKLAQSFMVRSQDPTGCVRLYTPGWVLDERWVNIQRNQVLWPRPRFDEWEARLEIDYDPEAISAQELTDYIGRAGLFVGVGSNRPEKQTGNGGTNGMFEIAI